MGLKQFRIEFTHPGSSVFASQTLRGKVVLELSSDKVINCLEIHCSGKGKVHWKESQGNGQGTFPAQKRAHLTLPKNQELENGKARMTSCSGMNSQTMISVEECYIEEKLVLLETRNCDKLLVEKGCSDYPFEFQIPSSSPSSFQGPYGNVKYFLEARLQRPKHPNDRVIKVPFTVNGLLDLNKDPRHFNPRIPSADHYVTELKKISKRTTTFFSSCLCWVNKRTGLNQVGFHLRLYKSLFVPGEYIQFVADMRNMSPTDVSGVTLSLIQETNYFVGNKCRSGLKHAVATAKGPSVASGQQEIWETNPIDSLFLQIPAVPPTNLGSSQIIEVKYFLQMEMEFYGQKNIKGQLPILIGSIPLRSVFRDFVNLKKRNGDPGEDNGASRKGFGVSMGYPDLPSPTFEEAVCFTPSLDYFLVGNGAQSRPSGSQKIQIRSIPDGQAERDGEINLNDEVESDDEYLSLNSSQNLEKYDAKYVPLYAKYSTAYAIDG